MGFRSMIGLVFLGGLSIPIDNFFADLFGQGQLNLLTVGSRQSGDALLNRLDFIFNFRLVDTFFFGDSFAAESGKLDGFVQARLDRLWIGDLDRHIDWANLRDVVGSLLGNFLAVLMSIRVISVSISWLANSHHLDVSLLNKVHINSLGCGILSPWFIVIGADLIINRLNGFLANRSGLSVTIFTINNLLNGDVNILTVGLKGRCANVSQFSHIFNRAVVLGVLIAIRGLVIGSRLVASIVRCWLVVASIRGRWVAIGLGGDSHNKGEEGNESKRL